MNSVTAILKQSGQSFYSPSHMQPIEALHLGVTSARVKTTKLLCVVDDGIGNTVDAINNLLELYDTELSRFC